jgi:uncharacterized protein (DUF362 family)
MAHLTRRQFLMFAAAFSGSAVFGQFLTACAPKPQPTSTLNPTPLPKFTRTPVPSQTSSATSASNPTPSPTKTAQSALPEMAVARGGEPDVMVRRSIAALGGMEKFVPKGANVIIKPNICVAYHSYEYAATTNPWVVGTLVKLCFEAGAGSVRVMDFPFGGSGQEAYKVSGIQEQVETAGGQMVIMSGMKFIQTEIPNAEDLKNVAVYDDILKADVFINVPIAKNHELAILTLGMKNLLGIVQDRERLHFNLGLRLSDLTSFAYPTLTVIDAVRILMANGPTGGNLDDVKKTDTIIASADIVAADSYATSLFGYAPDDISYIREGARRGLGVKDLQSIKIEEISVGA